MTTPATVEAFAELVLEQTKARMMRDYPTPYPDGTHQGDTYVVEVKPGKVYTKVNVGPAHNISGKYMVENATGIIFGIKAYGKVHRGHTYGTLETVDRWDWGGYRGIERPDLALKSSRELTEEPHAFHPCPDARSAALCADCGQQEHHFWHRPDPTERNAQ